jgi:hypothetical protein
LLFPFLIFIFASVAQLHLTLLNTKYREQGAKQNELERIAVDAREIMKDYSAIDFGQFAVKSIELSDRNAFEEETGYWKSMSKISLP